MEFARVVHTQVFVMQAQAHRTRNGPLDLQRGGGDDARDVSDGRDLVEDVFNESDEVLVQFERCGPVRRAQAGGVAVVELYGQVGKAADLGVVGDGEDGEVSAKIGAFGSGYAHYRRLRA